VIARVLSRLALAVLSVSAVRAGAQTVPGKKNAPAPAKITIPVQKDASGKVVPLDGRQLFGVTCAACHQANGEGLVDRYPPLAGSEWVSGDPDRMLRIVLRGLTGEVDVQGEMFKGEMPAWGPQLEDAEIATVVSYVRDKFGGGASPATAAMVARVRKATAARKKPFTARDFRAKPASTSSR
jgi:mono/diheme cytochrome c family protein